MLGELLAFSRLTGVLGCLARHLGLGSTQSHCLPRFCLSFFKFLLIKVLDMSLSPHVLRLCSYLGLYGFDSISPIHSDISLSPLGILLSPQITFWSSKSNFLKSLFPHLFQEIAELAPVDVSSSQWAQVHEPCQSTEPQQCSPNETCSAELCPVSGWYQWCFAHLAGWTTCLPYPSPVIGSLTRSI